MSNAEIRRFLVQGTFTGKLATTKKDGSSHIVPIWFVLADSNSRNRRVSDIIFTTGSTSAKAKNIRRDARVSICVDDQTPQFSFVTVYGTAKIYHYKQKKLFQWATKIAQRYVGREKARAYDRRNSTEEEVLVRIKPKRIIAEKDIAAWD